MVQSAATPSQICSHKSSVMSPKTALCGRKGTKLFQAATVPSGQVNLRWSQERTLSTHSTNQLALLLTAMHLQSILRLSCNVQNTVQWSWLWLVRKYTNLLSNCRRGSLTSQIQDCSQTPAGHDKFVKLEHAQTEIHLNRRTFGVWRRGGGWGSQACACGCIEMVKPWISKVTQSCNLPMV